MEARYFFVLNFSFLQPCFWHSSIQYFVSKYRRSTDC